jgi:activator of 2-hydroxyglutaryl-CoA dehydratase
MGYDVEHIGPLTATSTSPVTISSVCAVFAESEVINHVSEGQTPADIMHGAIVSLADRALQLMKRVKMEPEFTLLGGILRFATIAPSQNLIRANSLVLSIGPCQTPSASRNASVQPSQRWSGPLNASHNMPLHT